MKDIKMINEFETATQVYNKIMAGDYHTETFSTDDLVFRTKKMQIRSVKLNAAKVSSIVEHVTEFGTEDLFSNVVVLVNDDNEIIQLLDGNHTVAARQKLDMPMTTAYRVPFSELYYNDEVARKLGFQLNVVEDKSTECSNDDVKELIRGDRNRGIDINTTEYRDEMCQLLKRPRNGMKKMINTVSGEEDGNRRVLTQAEINEVEEQYIDNYPDSIVMVHLCRTAHEQGLGATINRMTNEGTEHAVMILYHSSLQHEKTEKRVVDTIEASADFHGLDIDVVVLGFAENKVEI